MIQLPRGKVRLHTCYIRTLKQSLICIVFNFFFFFYFCLRNLVGTLHSIVQNNKKKKFHHGDENYLYYTRNVAMFIWSLFNQKFKEKTCLALTVSGMKYNITDQDHTKQLPNMVQYRARKAHILKSACVMK